MVARNPRPQGLAGVSPQFFDDQAGTRQNLESRSQIEALQRKTSPRGGTPTDAQLWYYRDEGTAGFYVTGTVSRNPGDADIDIPGTGFPLPLLYLAERLSVEFYVATITTTSGTSYLKLDLLGKQGTSASETIVASSQQMLPILTSQAYYANMVVDLKDSLTGGRIRARIGTTGGTISIPAGAPTRQHFTIYVPGGT